MGRTLQVLVLVFALIVAVLPAGAAPNPGPEPQVPQAPLTDRDGDRISDGLGQALAAAAANDRFDVIVTWTGPVDVPRAERAAGKFPINRHFGVIDGFHAVMNAAQIKALARVPGVFRIEENFTVTAAMDEARTEYGTDAARQSFGVDGTGINVCVLDTGADPNHEQLDSRLAGFFDSINGQTVAYDDHGHGTHVASMLLGDGDGQSGNAAQYRGVAPGATLYAGKVLSSAGSGSEAQIIAGIDWCIELHNRADLDIHLMSMSLGTSTGSDGSDALSQAVNNAVAAGIVAVIAAGNSGDGPESVGSPGAAASAITVGAASKISAGPYLAPFSSRGPTLDGRLKPDIVAPGVAITAADANTGTGYATYSGTSMATPFTAGTIALAMQRNQSLTAGQIKTNLATTAVDLGPPGPDNNWGPGLLDGYSFIELASGTTAGPALELPAHTPLSDVVADNGLWTYDFPIGPNDVGSTIAATVLIDGALECSFWFFGMCFIYEWSPDLDARLLNPNGQAVWTSECPLSGDCGSTGQQETIHVTAQLEGIYRLEVYPFAGEPNLGTGGAFSVDLFTGPIGGTPPPANNPPVATDDQGLTDEDVAIVVDVLANDTDSDNDNLFVASVTDPANGTATTDGTSVNYTPDTDYYGTDTFDYTVADGKGGTDSATVTVTVTAVNDLPVAVDDAYSTTEDTALTVTAPGVLDNDTDPENDPLSAVLASGPSDGTVGLNADGSFTYTPDANFNGTDSFTYTAFDGVASSDVASVTITVDAVNNAPEAYDDAYTTDEDTALTVSAPGVLGNDNDPDDDTLIAVLESGPSSGSLALNADGSFTYTPDLDFNGADSFTYTADDGSLSSDPATVTIDVVAVNDPPVAVDDAHTTQQDGVLTVSAPGVLGNDTDIENDPLTAQLGDSPTNGALVLNADGSFTYTPSPGFHGTDSFTYAAWDGEALSQPATVVLTIEQTPVATMHVALEGTSSGVAKGKWTATVVARVLTEPDTPVEGAVVDYHWSDGTNGTCTTGSDGRCDAALTLKKRLEAVDFLVDNVTHSGYSYDEDGSITSVTVRQ